jgi:hypothetical protein
METKGLLMWYWHTDEMPVLALNYQVVVFARHVEWRY